LHLVTVRDRDGLQALAPLVRMRLGAGPVATDYFVPLGQEQADYGGFLLGPDPASTAPLLLDHLDELVSGHGALVTLPRLLAGGSTDRSLRDHVWSPGVELVRTASATCPYTDLTSFPDPGAQLDRIAQRRKLPRLLRRLEDEHRVEFRYHDTSPRALDELIAVHLHRWETKDEAMQGLFATTRLRRFARHLVTQLEADDAVRLSTLRVDDLPIAACLGYLAGGRYHYHKPAFEPSFATYSPGLQLLWQLMRRVADDGGTEFDFGRGASSYKEHWATGTRTLESLQLRPGPDPGPPPRSPGQGRRVAGPPPAPAPGG
jgi:CelD/BcsL family acetyltransferase involved in cellulose biosynthesis